LYLHDQCGGYQSGKSSYWRKIDGNSIWLIRFDRTGPH
jgi:hypothetical protein